MKKFFAPIVSCLFAANAFGLGQTTDGQLNASEKAYILSRFCTEVKYNFAFYICYARVLNLQL